jgi:hypothetical protein
MHKRSTLIIALAVLALALGPIAFAHNGVEHVMGTVTAISAGSITVQTAQHTEATVLLDSSTKFTNKGAAAALKDLKIGERVIIDAKPDAAKKLVGVTVRWGAAPHPPHQ